MSADTPAPGGHSTATELLHTLNNRLTVILGFADLLSETVPASDPRHADVMEIVKAVYQAVDLIPQLAEELKR
jgi:hypothetical protein